MINQNDNIKISNVTLIVLKLLDIHQPSEFQISVVSSLIGSDTKLAVKKLKNSGLFL